MSADADLNRSVLHSHAGDALIPAPHSRERGKIEETDVQLRELDPEGGAKGRPHLTPGKEDIPLVQQKYPELRQVRSARAYPANIPILEESVFAAAMRPVLQWGLSALVGM